MQVYVVMGNDFPDSVFSTKHLADAYVEAKNTAEKEAERKKHHHRRIFWRVYDFALDASAS